MLYELYNTTTEVVEAQEEMSGDVMHRRNESLRRNGEPQRWIIADSARRSIVVEVFKSLGIEIAQINVRNGWEVPTPLTWDDRDRVPALLALIHSEVSEALEAFRKDDRENFIEELADVVIRTVDLGEGLGFLLGKEIRAKLEKNRKRKHKHGGKRL